MNRILSTLVLLLLISSISFCQDNTSSQRNFSFLEAGGAGLFFSINYERQLSKEPGFSWRVGLGGYSEGDFYVTYSTGLAYLFALNEGENSFIELGINATIAREYTGLRQDGRYADLFENIIPTISYRKQFENNVFYKAGFSPVFNRFSFTPWLGVAIGKRF